MAKLSLEALTEMDGFIAAALVDSETGLALSTKGTGVPTGGYYFKQLLDRQTIK